jgi:hypothetical protein
MKQEEQERVEMVLSEIQSILPELPPIQKTRVEQTNASAVVVSQFDALNEAPTVESGSAIPLTAHYVQNRQSEPKTSAEAFAQEVEALLGISLDRNSCQRKDVAPDRLSP